MSKNKKTTPTVKEKKAKPLYTAKTPKKSKPVSKEAKPSLVQSLKDLFVFPRYDYKKNKSIIFAGDPGIKNFAYVIMEAPDTICKTVEELTPDLVIDFLKEVKILSCGFLKSCLTELRQENIVPYIQKFKWDNRDVFKCNPDYLVLERYQTRDLRGPRNEVINFNISNVINTLLHSNHPIRNTRLLIAAQWKRYFNLDKTGQVKGLDLVYDTWKKDKQLRKTDGLTDHQTDAFLIGVYHLLDLSLESKKENPEIREKVVNYLIANTASYFRNYFKEKRLNG